MHWYGNLGDGTAGRDRRRRHLTITPAAGFTGTVNMTATNNDGMTATTTFTPKSVNVASGAVTTSFVVQASQTSAQLVKPGLMPNSGTHPSGKGPWYAAGSGATLACVLLLTFPRRRSWGTLLALLLSVRGSSCCGLRIDAARLQAAAVGVAVGAEVVRSTERHCRYLHLHDNGSFGYLGSQYAGDCNRPIIPLQ